MPVAQAGNASKPDSSAEATSPSGRTTGGSSVLKSKRQRREDMQAPGRAEASDPNR